MEGYFTFQWGGGGCFSDGGTSYLSGGGEVSHGGGASVLMGGGGGSKNIIGWGGAPPHVSPPPLWETLEPFVQKVLLEEMEVVNDNASAFMHLNKKINNGKRLLFKPG